MLSVKSAEHLIENRAVERFLVLEVVVQQRLVDSGGARDGVGARPGHAFAGEFPDRGLQDGGAAFFGLSPGAQIAIWRERLSWRISY